ncbi:MAG: hypothetical protein CSB44_12165 [Gammaproteobacteria bacterium]|nr:MAG: hypothetical protein CSB44_12165 [Gammaproteobacteria bacterium]PIE37020.1 MAG: hypothetical protein CSA54_02305 [Gammaproteobacteria bacterium]
MWDSSDSDARIATFRTAMDAFTSGGHLIVAERPKDTALVRQAIAEGGWASVWAKSKRLVRRRSNVRASRRQQAYSSTSARASKSFSTHARDSGEHARRPATARKLPPQRHKHTKPPPAKPTRVLSGRVHGLTSPE